MRFVGNCLNTSDYDDHVRTNRGYFNTCTAAGTLYPMASPATTTAAEMLRTALISMACVLVVMSVVIFVIGFICGHCFSRRWRKPSGKKVNESPSNLTTEPREDLELKENVAYITIRPNDKF